MSTQPIDLTVVIAPNPGKANKLLERCVRYSRSNEPSTLRYEVQRGFKDENADLEEFVARETYVDEEALNQHMNGPDVLALVEATESGELIESVKVVDRKPGAE